MEERLLDKLRRLAGELRCRLLGHEPGEWSGNLGDHDLRWKQCRRCPQWFFELQEAGIASEVGHE